MTAVPAPEGPAYRPEQLLSARHDTPDPTGPVTEWEPVAVAAPAPEAAVWHLLSIDTPASMCGDPYASHLTSVVADATCEPCREALRAALRETGDIFYATQEAPAPEAATPEVPSLHSLAHALHDAYWLVVGGDEYTWEGEEPEIREGWLAVAQTASDGASIAVKAVTDALAARLAEAESALESISAAREMRSDGELTDEGFATVVYDALDVLRAQKVARDRAALEARDDR